jgi:hypothetical protein
MHFVIKLVKRQLEDATTTVKGEKARRSSPPQLVCACVPVYATHGRLMDGSQGCSRAAHEDGLPRAY